MNFVVQSIEYVKHSPLENVRGFFFTASLLPLYCLVAAEKRCCQK